MTPFQRKRVLYQGGFFILFLFAPIFDLLRFDLTQGHLIVFGQPWTLGLDDYLAGRIDVHQMAFNILFRVFVPILALAAVFLGIAWRWGRLYCGWLCPHFSVVETINQLVRKASGKQSIWDRKPGPPWHPDGTPAPTDARYWLLAIPCALVFAFLWAVALLTYLLPPAEVYANLFNLTPTRNQALFIGAGTVLLFVEFTFARHLFCRYACAVGMFQSLVNGWFTVSRLRRRSRFAHRARGGRAPRRAAILAGAHRWIGRKGRTDLSRCRNPAITGTTGPAATPGIEPRPLSVADRPGRRA
jgi:ferredoxin-type protein NapH